MQRINSSKTNLVIQWIVIYPVDSAIQRLNNTGARPSRVLHMRSVHNNWTCFVWALLMNLSHGVKSAQLDGKLRNGTSITRNSVH